MTALLTRRAFGAGLCGCGATLLAACTATSDHLSRPAAPGQKIQSEVPAGYRPALASDEGEIWASIGKVEDQVKQSRFLVRDAALNEYVRGQGDSMAGDNRSDVRVYLIRTPVFNATMYPTGMMQVWSGFLLRSRNEAQMAAVLGHELGHFVRRHSLQKWRDSRNKQDFAVFASLGLAVAGLGAVGELARLAAVASQFGFNREQEREADTYGMQLLVELGYDPYQAAMVWQQQMEDEQAAEDGPRSRSLLFASHPSGAERQQNMSDQAKATGLQPGQGAVNADRYRRVMAGARPWMLRDEVRLRTPGPSLALFNRLLSDDPQDAEVLFARGEVRRLRARNNDFDLALADYAAAAATGRAPATTHRSTGFLLQRRQDFTGAAAAFGRYLDTEPQAEDRAVIAAMIKNGGRP